MRSTETVVTIDIGNSRIKLGRFDRAQATGGLPVPSDTLTLAPPGPGEPLDLAPLGEWLQVLPVDTRLIVGSVSRPSLGYLREFLADFSGGAWDRLHELSGSDMPIENRTDAPGRVGIDRLAAAVAACQIRRPGAPVAVIDFGTAITVDLVSSDGAFEGGAILPGVDLAADALHQRTDALPRVELQWNAKSPPAIGKSTEAAIAAGLYWGTVGAVRELIARQSDSLTTAPQVLVTGSASPELARLLGSPDYSVRYLPHLVLAGLAIAAAANEEPAS